MRLVGVTIEGSATQVARLRTGEVEILTGVEEFWSDPHGWADKHPVAVVPIEQVRFVPPVVPAARIICVGLNYRAHAAEGSFEVPEYPTLFGRWTPSLSVGGDAAPVPAGEDGLDWEAEVAAYVSRPLCDANPQEAWDAVFGYSTFNDLTARRAQKLTAQWTLGKNGDRSGPMGPIVPRREVGSLRDGLRVQTRVNGTTVQDGNTRDMIFDVGSVLSLISHTFTLNPGDVIATGTPEGVGYVRDPPWLLGPGDVVEVEIERLGTLRTPIAGPQTRLNRP
jgi:2-keto-4-pentenoate hydratase/2-oxohepta-3-ene-1,7-dioic acid hydratase in catechol pathway